MGTPNSNSQIILGIPQKKTRTNNSVAPNFSVKINEDMIEEIFSFLPIKHAVQIVTVSTRYRNSWVFSRNLIFDKNLFVRLPHEYLIEIIKRVFDSHSGSKIQTFQLYLNPEGLEPLIEKWLGICIQKEIEELDFFFLHPFNLHPYFLDVQSIRKLKLTSCGIEIPRSISGLRLLNTLSLCLVSVKESLLEVLFFHCQQLHTLELRYCTELEHLHVTAKNFKNFRVLRVWLCPGVSKIDIDAPTLSSITYGGVALKINFLQQIQLDDAFIYFLPAFHYKSSLRVESMVFHLLHVNVFTTTNTFLEGFTARIRNFWNLKEFHMIMDRSSCFNICDVVSFIKKCPRLQRLFIDLNDYRMEYGPYLVLHERNRFKNSHHIFNRLKFIKLININFYDYEIDLIRVLLRNAIGLEGLVLITPRNGPKNLPRPHAYEKFHSWKASPSCIVYEHLNDSSGVHPKHTNLWFM